jgi:hypothetical protein
VTRAWKRAPPSSGPSAAEMLYRPPATEPQTKFRELAVVIALIAFGIVITFWGGWEIGALIP